MSDEQWAQLASLFDTPQSTGRPRRHDRRSIVNAVLYVARTGCQWRHLPGDFPPWGTVWWHFRRWRDDGTWEQAVTMLRRACRQQAGRDPEPTVAIIDAQSVKSGRLGPRDAIGTDGGKRVKGRKRCLLCDVLGLPLAIEVGSAQPHDSKGGWDLLRRAKLQLPFVGTVLADAGYQSIVTDVDRRLRLDLDIRRKPTDVVGFAPVPHCWKVERSFAWFSRWRRLRNDYEATPTSSRAWCHVAAIGMMLNRLHPAI